MKADQLSQTAAFLAVKFYGLTQIPRFQSLFDKNTIEFYDRLVKTMPAPIRYYHYWLQSEIIRKFYIWSEEFLLPGDLLHVVARKWYFHRMIKKLTAEGYNQIIVLGAGFDHLAYFYSQIGLHCFEFDTPYMTNYKRRFLSECYPQKSHPKIITAHLPADPLNKQFSEQPDLDPQKKTIIVAEGLFDYLTKQTVSASFRQMRSYFSHNLTILCTHFALDELPPFHRYVFKKSVQLVGEPLQLNTTINDFTQLLKKEKFETQQLYDSHKIKGTLSKYLNTKLEVLKGFYLLRTTIRNQE